ncbi:MAG: Rap1a/Tai family immunity protein [Pseudomonadota bacterium]
MHPVLPSLAAGLLLLAGHTTVQASQVSDGSVVLRMCKGADKVRSLSVMCHSYLNGYLDGARHYARDGKLSFCLGEGDKEKAPAALVAWIIAHPEVQTQPAGSVLHKALSETFPCQRGR